jgi:hypothetical protein
MKPGRCRRRRQRGSKKYAERGGDADEGGRGGDIHFDFLIYLMNGD